MRVTVVLEPDVLAAVEEMRRVDGVGLSDAVNALARRALAQTQTPPQRFEQERHDMGAFLLPIDDIAAVLDVLEGEGHR